MRGERGGEVRLRGGWGLEKERRERVRRREREREGEIGGKDERERERERESICVRGGWGGFVAAHLPGETGALA